MNDDESTSDRLSEAEIRKDALQDGFTAATQTVGTVATIITDAVGEIGRALGGLATEIFEIRDSARKASQDHATHAPKPDPSGRSVEVEGELGQPNDS